MILIDVNLLIYAHNADSDEHVSAKAWLEKQLAGDIRVGLPWHTLLGFLRLTSNVRVFPAAWRPSEAWNVVASLLANDSVWIPQPTERHPSVLGALLSQPGVTANLVSDAHLAALAIEHGLTLCSTDGDFARFRSLSWLNPLVSA